MSRMPDDQKNDQAPPRPGDPPPPPYAPDLDLIDLLERGAKVTDQQIRDAFLPYASPE